jgi:hypothetical protein
MRKVLLVIVFIVLTLTVFLVGAYLYSNRNNKSSSLQVYTVAQKPNSFPEIAWEDIVSGKLLSYLENQDAKGKLPTISPEAKPIETPSVSNQEYYQKNGIVSLQMTSNDVISNKYKDTKARPFRFVAFFKTNLNGIGYFVLVQKWLNPDCSIAFLPLIVPESLSATGNALSAYYQDLISDNTVYFLGPILKIKSLTQCNGILPKRET